MTVNANAAPVTPEISNTIALLKDGRQTVRIVCFGDSITGVYYHSGGRCAWSDMLGAGLRFVYPRAKIEMINAGGSGRTTVGAMDQIGSTVLSRKPQLVVAMFGMNDVVNVPAETYRSNLMQIVKQCRAVGAEVVLCTPTATYPNAERPADKLTQFCGIVRSVGMELQTPVVDCYRAFDDIRVRDPRAWMLMMSETIHPNMNGHKVIAEEIIATLTARRVSLADEPPPFPVIPRTLALLAEGKTVKVIAMPPYDEIIVRAVREIKSDGRVEVTTWPTAGKSLADIQAWSPGVRPMKPDLVVLAVPASAVGTTEADVIARHTIIIQNSISNGRQEWDCCGVHPSVTKAKLSAGEMKLAQSGAEVFQALHIGTVMRPTNDLSSAEEVFSRWLRSQTQRETKRRD